MVDSGKSERSWYLIHSKPNQETLAQENLQRQGYETYLPLMPTRKKHRGKTQRVIAPMFPRYLFIHLNQETDNWGPIRSTLGVASLIRFGMVPAKVPNELVASIQSNEDEEGIQVIENKSFSKGDRVRIAEGPFEGYEAIFTSESARERVVVLLKITEHCAKLEINPDALEKL